MEESYINVKKIIRFKSLELIINSLKLYITLQYLKGYDTGYKKVNLNFYNLLNPNGNKRFEF